MNSQREPDWFWCGLDFFCFVLQKFAAVVVFLVVFIRIFSCFSWYVLNAAAADAVFKEALPFCTSAVVSQMNVHIARTQLTTAHFQFGWRRRSRQQHLCSANRIDADTLKSYFPHWWNLLEPHWTICIQLVCWYQPVASKCVYYCVIMQECHIEPRCVCSTDCQGIRAPTQ